MEVRSGPGSVRECAAAAVTGIGVIQERSNDLIAAVEVNGSGGTINAQRRGGVSASRANDERQGVVTARKDGGTCVEQRLTGVGVAAAEGQRAISRLREAVRAGRND